MAKRVLVTETNAPVSRLAEAVARLLIEREKARPALTLVDGSKPPTGATTLPTHDPSSPVPPLV